MATDNDNTAIFRNSWSLYDLITARNYMYHQEIYADVATLLKQQGARKPYRLLDLGCGNARFLASSLEVAPPAGYAGIDLSAKALEEARNWLATISDVALLKADLLQALEGQALPHDQYDVIFSGFAIHHLDAAAKQRFFHAAAQSLAKDGSIILVDIVRDPDQSRDAFLKSYVEFMQQRWTELSAEQFHEARSHIETFDFPETLDDLTSMAREAGFHSAQLTSKYGHHHIVTFSTQTA